MIYDGVNILAQALNDLNHFEAHSIECYWDSELSNNGVKVKALHQGAWSHGTTVINYCRQVQLEGLTGFVAFDSDTGFRSKISFDILSITEDGFEIIGQWKDDGVGVHRHPELWQHHFATVEERKLIRVTTVLNDPFLMNTKSSRELKGNDRYEGYVVDLMKEIANLMNVRFEINIVKDRKYGAMVNASTNEWNGKLL